MSLSFDGFYCYFIFGTAGIYVRRFPLDRIPRFLVTFVPHIVLSFTSSDCEEVVATGHDLLTGSVPGKNPDDVATVIIIHLVYDERIIKGYHW